MTSEPTPLTPLCGRGSMSGLSYLCGPAWSQPTMGSTRPSLNRPTQPVLVWPIDRLPAVISQHDYFGPWQP
ncbi:hypothetical protein ACOMHN_052294 [Nucella lapillus]